MSVKKIYSNYQSRKLDDILWLHKQVDELEALDDSYYIAQRDAYNRRQKDLWNRESDNLQKRSEKYYGANEPTPITDLTSFKEPIRNKIQELEHKINLLKAELDNNMASSEYTPLYLDGDSGRWLYQDIVYEVKGGHSDEEKRLLVLDFAAKERRKFERLKNKFSGKKSDEVKYERTRIPEEVRIAVWRRDQGRCARCGSRENLEYDHIVPVSKGGGNTERNIELLCQDCNRAKGNRIE